MQGFADMHSHQFDDQCFNPMKDKFLWAQLLHMKTSQPSRNRAVIARQKFHRTVFIAAGLYNMGWGVFSVADPQWLFRFAGMPLQNHPQVFACLGMVVGLYGIVYLEVARLPQRGWLLAAVGLLGKVLGPVGLAGLIWSRTWPAKTAILCVTNDLIWWIPFGLYLYDAWPAFWTEVIAEMKKLK